MTLYELNQAGYASLPNMTKTEIQKAKDSLLQYLTTFDSNTYMLLNNESHYYTIFMYKSRHDYLKMVNEIFSLVLELGDLKGIERNGSYVEFWITKDSECKMYMLFDYERGVIRV